MDKSANSPVESPYKPSLVKAITRAMDQRYAVPCILVTISKVIELAQPFMVGVIILSLQEQIVNPYEWRVKYVVLGTSVAFMLSNLITAFCRHRGNLLATRVGNNIRTALTFMILKKVLRVSLSSLDETDVGQIMNVLANDLKRFEQMSWFLTFIPITM